jgi:hypothetical protein
MPTGRPEARPVHVSQIAAKLAAVELPAGALTVQALGRARFEAFQHAGLNLHGSQEQVPESRLDDLRYAVIDLAAVTLQALRTATRATEPPTLLSTDSGDPARLVSQTMFWADHVLVPHRAGGAVCDRPRRRGAMTQILATRPY